MSLLTMMARATIAPTMPTEAKSIQAGKNAPKTTKDGAPASEQPVKETEARNRRAAARSWSVLGNGFTDVTNRIRIKLRSRRGVPLQQLLCYFGVGVESRAIWAGAPTVTLCPSFDRDWLIRDCSP
jgi:hypothetical protein